MNEKKEIDASNTELLKALDEGQRELDELMRAVGNTLQPLIPGEQTYDRLQRIDRKANHIRYARHYLELSFLMAKEAIKA